MVVAEHVWPAKAKAFILRPPENKEEFSSL